MGRAIVRQAEAFLFDEPLSNLDAKLRGQMRTEISRLQRRLAITTVYVTHDQTEAMTLGDRVCVLRKGKIQQVASPRELYEQPVNLFVAGFIGSPPMNFLPATLEGNKLRMPFGEVELDDKRVEGRLRAGPAARRHPAGVLRGRLAGRGAQEAAGLDVPRPRRRHRVAGRLAVRLHPLRGAGGDHRAAARAVAGAGLARSCARRPSSRSTRPAGSARAGRRSSGSTPARSTSSTRRPART